MSLNILLVEDAAMAVIGAKMVLKNFDTMVTVAENGATALALATAQHFDLILMDIGLPDTDGFALTQAIHEKCPLNRTTKVIAVTAHAGDDYKPKVPEYGLVGLIAKPLTPTNFIEALNAADIAL